MYGFRGVFPPGKGAMVFAQNRRYMDRIFSRKGLNDHRTRILFIAFLNLLLRQISGAGDLAVEIIRMSRAVTGNPSACLRPSRSVGRMGMDHASGFSTS